MTDCCVVVVDATRARFFTLEPAGVPEVEFGPKLVEQKCLMNPEMELPERELFHEARSGGNRGPSGSMHSFDDHRSKRLIEYERRFAKLIVGEARRQADSWKPRRVVLAASSRMLGLLRNEKDFPNGGKTDVHTLASDMTKLSPLEIQAHLAKERLVAACVKPAALG